MDQKTIPVTGDLNVAPSPRERISVQVAEIVFAISSDQPVASIRFNRAYQGFFCAGEPEVTVHARYDGLPEVDLDRAHLVFDSETVWSLYRMGDQHVFRFQSPAIGPEPYRLAVFSDDFCRGEVYSLRPEPPWSVDGTLPNPLDFPLSEVLMVCLLAQGRGLMVHASGVDDDGRGYLFCGNSTHGKSTMARQWADEATILNDDRIVLRLRDGRFWMYGTPWHGDFTGVSRRGVPLEKVFFLRHAPDNRVERKTGIAASTMLLARCFPPLWDDEGIRFTLDFCSQLVETVPCYELGFVPDKRVLDVVRCAG